MNNSPKNVEPHWNLLPHDPIGFFELAEGFDRKSLKRKYNQLIRQFKPERFPVEFQKIRAAYEQLDGQLRYGQSSTPQANFQWDQIHRTTDVESHQKPERPADRPVKPATDVFDSDQTRQPERSPVEHKVQPEVVVPEPQPRVVSVPIYQRIESESPVAIYRELQNKSDKSPFDYFAMALISDIVGQDPLSFFKLILSGIKQYPNENGLLVLLQEYLHGEIETHQLPNILLTISKVIANDRFYFITERLWEQLLREVDFVVWQKTLERCEANLQDFQIMGRLVFYIHIGAAAIWKATPGWTQKTFQFLDSHSTEVPAHIEMDLELLYQLRDYLNDYQNSPEINSNPTLQSIHQAISQYFLLGGQRGDQAVISCQTGFAQNASSILQNFGPDTGFNDQQLMIWDYINDEVCQRSDIFPTIDARKLREKIYDLLNHFNRGEVYGAADDVRYYGLRWGPYLVAGLAPFLFFACLINRLWAYPIALFLAAGAVALVHFLYKPFDRYEGFMEKRIERKYYSQWRGRFVQLFEETQQSHRNVSDALIDVIRAHAERLGFASWLWRSVPQDVGLHLYASAVRYLR